MTWSRRAFGVWALATAIWLLVAMLMLVRTWPEPLAGIEHTSKFENVDDADEAVSGRAVRAQTVLRAAVKDHIAQFLLIAAIPPAFLFVLVWIALRVAGLPFPSFRRETNTTHRASR